MPYDLHQWIEWIVSDFEPRVRVADEPGAYARRLTLDAVYLLSRDQQQVAHRAAGVRRSVDRALAAAWQRLCDEQTREAMAPHTLTAAVSLFAEAQQFLGVEAVRTERPLQLVLDRRPFI